MKLQSVEEYVDGNNRYTDKMMIYISERGGLDLRVSLDGDRKG